MNGNIKIITIDQAVCGMVLAKSILKDGKVLVYRNSPLEEKDIELLRREKINENLFIYENITYSSEKDLNLQEKEIITVPEVFKKIDSLEKTYTELSSTLSNIFYRLESLTNSTNKQIREFCNTLLSKSNDSGIIIHDLVLYGSSNDFLYRHSINVALLANLLGTWLNFKKDTLNLLTYSALLHDIGKMKIDNNILNKASSLTYAEKEQLENHVKYGYNIVRCINYLDRSVSQGILFHHEKINGTGYPFKLNGDKITTFAKIIAIADAFDNYNSNRIHTKKIGPFQAIESLNEDSFNGSLDYAYTNTFIKNILNFFIGKDVLLSNNTTAQIIMMDKNNLDRPVININGEFINLTLRKDLNIEHFIFN